MTKWSLKNVFQGAAVFAAFFAAFTLLLAIMFCGFAGVGKVEPDSNFGLGSGVIFVFVTGIIIFSQHLRVAVANGVSRKTLFQSLCLCGVALAAAVTVAESLLSLFLRFVLGLFTNVQFVTDSQRTMEGFFLNLVGSILMISLGLFIGGAYYRMSRILKILVSVMVPVLFFFGIPGLFMLMPQPVSQSVPVALLNACISFFSASIGNQILVFVGLFLCNFLFTWLLLRRAPVKSIGK